MAAQGYPGQFPGGLTTGYENIGAVKKQSASSAGYPGVFPGALTTSYRNIGAVQKDVPVVPPPAGSGRLTATGRMIASGRISAGIRRAAGTRLTV